MAVASCFTLAVITALLCLGLAVDTLGAELKRSQAQLGVNLSGIADWNTEHPFVDVFRLSRAWISQQQGQAWGKGPALHLDEHGWVKSLAPGCSADTPILTAGHAPAGDYVCLYDGVGEIAFANNSRVVSNSPGRLVAHIDGSKGGTFFSIRSTDPDNPVRNIRILMPGCQESSASNAFTRTFLDRWRGFAALRFMDWMDTNGSKQTQWSDRPRLLDASWTVKGIPLEIMLELCNQLRISPWFCMPHLASDDYVRRFAAAVKQGLDPSLKIYIEYSNEVWNSMFEQHRYAEQQAQKLELGPEGRLWEGTARFYARRSIEVFEIWEQVLEGRARLVRVIAWQAASGPYWTDNLLLAQPETARHCDALAIAPYISFMPSPNNQHLKPDEVARWSVERLLDEVQTNALPECIAWMRQQKAVADKYGLKLVCYEAGQHLVGVGGAENNDALTRLLISANRHPRMGQIYTQYLAAWRDLDGDLICLFSSIATSSKWGSWGLLEGADQTTSPKYDAVMQWKEHNFRN